MTTESHRPRLLRRPEVEHRVGFSRSTLYSLVQAGQFPAPVKIGARCVAWPEQAIDQWIASRTPTRYAGEVTA